VKGPYRDIVLHVWDNFVEYVPSLRAAKSMAPHLSRLHYPTSSGSAKVSRISSSLAMERVARCPPSFLSSSLSSSNLHMTDLPFYFQAIMQLIASRGASLSLRSLLGSRPLPDHLRCANPCRHQEEGASDRQGARHGDSLTSRHLSALVVPRGTLFLVETQFNRRELDTPILGCSCRLPRPSSPSRTCRRLRRGTGRSSDPVRLLCFLVLSSCPSSSRRTNQPLLTHLVLLPLLL
jgi:hypothetical protein